MRMDLGYQIWRASCSTLSCDSYEGQKVDTLLPALRTAPRTKEGKVLFLELCMRVHHSRGGWGKQS
jgi:hypothetical protein